MTQERVATYEELFCDNQDKDCKDVSINELINKRKADEIVFEFLLDRFRKIKSLIDSLQESNY